MEKICVQTNVAEVDNSAIKCEQHISTDCIIYENALTYLGLPENSSVTDVINTLLISLIDTRNRLLLAEENINNLQNP